jgi:predicted small integral membrane protein
MRRRLFIALLFAALVVLATLGLVLRVGREATA